MQNGSVVVPELLVNNLKSPDYSDIRDFSLGISKEGIQQEPFLSVYCGLIGLDFIATIPKYLRNYKI